MSAIDPTNTGRIEGAFAAFARQPNGGVIVTASASAVVHRELIISLLMRYRLPNVYPFRYCSANGASPPMGLIRSRFTYAQLITSIVFSKSRCRLTCRWPPSFEQCLLMVHALARIHAEWWDHPRLGVTVGKWLDNLAISKLMEQCTGLYKSFADRLGDRLSPQRRELYDRFIEAAPRQLAHYQARRNLSIVHGDAHVWNYFMPRDGSDDIRLFDWDAWRIGRAANDLAYMIATHWYPERRQRMERPLLDHYHAALMTHGVSGYGRSDLHDDYRVSVLWQLMTPVWQVALDLPPMIWWGHLERIMLAVDDLGCRDLL